jgi:cob(I)alamin adenosyltransferase
LKGERRGLVQVFTGNGKGKTTAALGTVLRATGHGHSVFIIFFMKGDYAYGEYEALSRLPGVEFVTYGFRRLTDPTNIRPEEREQARQAMEKAREAVTGGRYDLVVLDEINVAVGFGLIEMEEVLRLVEDKPPDVELILTGRYADNRLLEVADLVTEMVKVKHPFDEGVRARKGIEF